MGMDHYFENKGAKGFATDNKTGLQRFRKLREDALGRVIIFTDALYVKLIFKNKNWKYTKEDMRQMPEGSLGRDLAYFLDKNKFDLLPHLEVHDVFHVFLGFEPTIVEESKMQFLLFGNGRRTTDVLGTVLSAMILLPDCWSELLHHYRMGKAYKKFIDWDYGNMLLVDTESFKKAIGIVNNSKTTIYA
jgi:ubiquinone biosynthesis protein Coq4